MSSSAPEAGVRARALHVLRGFKEYFTAQQFRKAYKTRYAEKFSSGSVATREYLKTFSELSFFEEGEKFTLNSRKVAFDEESSSSDDDDDENAPEVEEEMDERNRDQLMKTIPVEDEVPKRQKLVEGQTSGEMGEEEEARYAKEQRKRRRGAIPPFSMENTPLNTMRQRDEIEDTRTAAGKRKIQKSKRDIVDDIYSEMTDSEEQYRKRIERRGQLSVSQRGEGEVNDGQNRRLNLHGKSSMLSDPQAFAPPALVTGSSDVTRIRRKEDSRVERTEGNVTKNPVPSIDEEDAESSLGLVRPDSQHVADDAEERLAVANEDCMDSTATLTLSVYSEVKDRTSFTLFIGEDKQNRISDVSKYRVPLLTNLQFHGRPARYKQVMQTRRYLENLGVRRIHSVYIDTLISAWAFTSFVKDFHVNSLIVEKDQQEDTLHKLLFQFEVNELLYYGPCEKMLYDDASSMITRLHILPKKKRNWSSFEDVKEPRSKAKKTEKVNENSMGVDCGELSNFEEEDFDAIMNTNTNEPISEDSEPEYEDEAKASQTLAEQGKEDKNSISTTSTDHDVSITTDQLNIPPQKVLQKCQRRAPSSARDRTKPIPCRNARNVRAVINEIVGGGTDDYMKANGTRRVADKKNRTAWKEETQEEASTEKIVTDSIADIQLSEDDEQMESETAEQPTQFASKAKKRKSREIEEFVERQAEVKQKELKKGRLPLKTLRVSSSKRGSVV